MEVADANIDQIRVIRDELGVSCQKQFQDFLEEFQEDGKTKYLEPAKELKEFQERSALEVSFVDVNKHNQDLSTIIVDEYLRIYPYICQAVTNFVNDKDDLKIEKKYYISFVDVYSRHRMRELKTEKIGMLTRIPGQVIRTHPVYLELVLGTFTCLDCKTVIKNVEQQFKEIQAHVPSGCIPRSIEVVLRAENVETVQAGDLYYFTGALIVVPDDEGSLSLPGAKVQLDSRHKLGEEAEGVGSLQDWGLRDLHYRMAFLACSVLAVHPLFNDINIPLAIDEITLDVMRKQMTDDKWKRLYEMTCDRNLYNNLTNSLFPSIHGNEEVKRGVLLMLFGGVSKTITQGLPFRGDINICIVGDPSTAKSQFLQQVSEFSPPAVYTSGKALSATGLKAVVKVKKTNDFVIEVCCIDEFDKMEPRDQATVVILEANEQQMISIAKPGFRATLNAHTSILAATNPINVRYDRAKSLQQNIALSVPVISHFDLFFTLVDECDEIMDYAIARKIVDLHSNIEENSQAIYSKEEMLWYITFARKFKPIINNGAEDLLVKSYTRLRLRHKTYTGKSSWRVTPRQLESLIRLAEAIARMEISYNVQPKHVKEAYRLLNKSIIRVKEPHIHLDEDDDKPDLNDKSQDGEDTPGVTKRNLVISYEEYKALTDMIITHIRLEGARLKEEKREHIKRSDVVKWYLYSIFDQIESEDECFKQKEIIDKVLDRLIFDEEVIISLSTDDEHDSFLTLRSN